MLQYRYDVLCEYAVSVTLTMMKGRTRHLRARENWSSAMMELLHPGLQNLFPYGDTPMVDFERMALLPIRTDIIPVL